MDTKTAERIGIAVGTSLVLLVLFRLLQRVTRGKRTVAFEMAGTNVAAQFLQIGHAFAVLLLLPGIAVNCATGDAIGTDITLALLFGSAGVVAIELVGAIGVRILMGGRLEREVLDGNIAAGIAGAANYVSIGVLASHAIGGTDVRGLLLSLAFFGIAVVTLTLFVILFRAITTYDDAEQIAGRNNAAAISYAGLSVAVSLIVSRALDGDFSNWSDSLIGFARLAGLALLLYPVRQIVVQGLLMWRAPTLRGGALDRDVGLERKLGVAVLEAVTYVSTAVTIIEIA